MKCQGKCVPIFFLLARWKKLGTNFEKIKIFGLVMQISLNSEGASHLPYSPYQE